ncbi:LacI family DNA-binding transcriptional regulator [Puniceicoccus vermicola]|uniref:LacI family DNA-binding transcriptional regulator n=1 Tax=Puniceicoccus vermicola TaxID=388746 RepID=A0A7X1E672_9BACT|nr:LacI family DNA-binding transcriptional regulator [Puniceicoccus vermicola]MBC2603813.1 LacI family DNA-binding transcriptional regulator [Puniceicoccus vermicola]
MSTRVTLKTIAEECGVSTATVSYALRRSSRIPQSTRDRISKVAQELGYRPDPSLSSLAARKSRGVNVPFYASVAVLHPDNSESRASQLFATHCHHFREKMLEFGCSVSDFELETDHYRTERIAQILQTRGIKGILLGWGKWPSSIRTFPWDQFSVISTERTDLGQSVDKVSMNHFHALDDIFAKLSNLPSRRYGMILHDDCPKTTREHIIGAFQANLFERPHLKGDVPPYSYHLGESADGIKKWFETYRPEVVISHRVIDPNVFQDAGIHFPEVPVIVIEIDEESPVQFSGFYTEGELGRTVATLLARKIRNDEVQETIHRPRLTLVNGIWRDGETLSI